MSVSLDGGLGTKEKPGSIQAVTGSVHRSGLPDNIRMSNTQYI